MTSGAFLVEDSDDMPETPDETPRADDTLPASYGHHEKPEREEARA